MTRLHLLQGASLVTALLLAACMNGPTAELDPEAAYPITVGPHMETLSVTYGAADSNAKLAAFASAFMSAGNGSITVSAPGPEASRATADRLVSLGVPRNRIVMGAMSQGNAVQLSYVGYGASSPPCGNWSENVAWTLENLPTPNWGCATQHNLAVLAADPRDLVTPQPMTPPDTERRMIVIDKWRKGEPTSAQKTQEQSGAVSQVAQ
jgi:pilus assembly protein CpaD